MSSGGNFFLGKYPAGVHFLFTSKVANPYPSNQARSNYKLLGGGFKKNVYVHPYLGKISIVTNILHQP